MDEKQAPPMSPPNPNHYERMLQWFEYKHLPERLQVISMRFHNLAHWMASEIPAGPERTVALRKLLEAKDCAVRAYLENRTAP